MLLRLAGLKEHATTAMMGKLGALMGKMRWGEQGQKVGEKRREGKYTHAQKKDGRKGWDGGGGIG